MKLCEGKYEFFKKVPGIADAPVLMCYRHDEPWRDFTGDHAVTALYDRAVELERKAARYDMIRAGFIDPTLIAAMDDIPEPNTPEEFDAAMDILVERSRAQTN